MHSQPWYDGCLVVCIMPWDAMSGETGACNHSKGGWMALNQSGYFAKEKKFAPVRSPNNSQDIRPVA